MLAFPLRTRGVSTRIVTLRQSLGLIPRQGRQVPDPDLISLICCSQETASALEDSNVTARAVGSMMHRPWQLTRYLVLAHLQITELLTKSGNRFICFAAAHESASVKGFGCRPFTDGATRRWAGVRKPPGKEPARGGQHGAAGAMGIWSRL